MMSFKLIHEEQKMKNSRELEENSGGNSKSSGRKKRLYQKLIIRIRIEQEFN